MGDLKLGEKKHLCFSLLHHTRDGSYNADLSCRALGRVTHLTVCGIIFGLGTKRELFEDDFMAGTLRRTPWREDLGSKRQLFEADFMQGTIGLSPWLEEDAHGVSDCGTTKRSSVGMVGSACSGVNSPSFSGVNGPSSGGVDGTFMFRMIGSACSGVNGP